MRSGTSSVNPIPIGDQTFGTDRRASRPVGSAGTSSLHLFGPGEETTRPDSPSAAIRILRPHPASRCCLAGGTRFVRLDALGPLSRRAR